MRQPRETTNKIINLAVDGVLSWETIARECLSYMSEDDVDDMATSNEWVDSEEDEELDTSDLLESLSKIIKSLSSNVTDDMIDHDWESPAIQITLGISVTNNTISWGWQSGDNSYTGGAYSYPYWGIGYVGKDLNDEECKSLANDLLEEALDQTV